MESTWHAAPLYKGFSGAGTRKLGCHRNIFWAAPWILHIIAPEPEPNLKRPKLPGRSNQVHFPALLGLGRRAPRAALYIPEWVEQSLEVHLGGLRSESTSILVSEQEQTWDSDSLTFQNACGLGICAKAFFICVENVVRARFGTLQASWRPPL